MKSYLIFISAAAISIASGSAVAQVPQRTSATYGDWTVRCVMRSKTKTCEMAQTMQIKGRPQPISQIAIGHQTKGKSLKMVIEVPVNVWLPGGVKLTARKEQGDITASFDRCLPVGCFAEAGINETQINALRRLKKNGKL